MSRRKQSCPQHLEHTKESEIKINKSPSPSNNNTTPENDDETMPNSKVITNENAGSNDKCSGYVDVSKVKTEPQCYDNNQANDATSAFPERVKPTVFCERPPTTRKHKCVDCGISFSNRTTYEVHVTHYCQGKLNRYSCITCDAKFPKQEMLKIHMESHTSNFTCNLCNAGFMTPHDCEMHMAGHLIFPKAKTEDKLSCPKCNHLPNNDADLMQHMWKRHVTKPIPDNERSIANHSTNGIDNNLLKTTSLEDKNLDITSLSPLITSTPTRPLSADAPSSMFTCIVCKALFSNVVQLQQHLLTAHSTRTGGLIPNKSNGSHHRREQVNVSPIAQKRMLDVTTDSEVSPPKREKVEIPHDADKYFGENDKMEGYCTDCCIPFRIAGNYQAHKQFYCASRHRNAKLEGTMEDNRPAKHSPKQRKDAPKKPKRTETTDSHMLYEGKGPFTNGLSAAMPPKKFFCQECNVGFSQKDTYLAHKTYYCESRRKEKSGNGRPSDEKAIKENQSSSKSPSQPHIPPDNVEETMASYINGMQMSQFQAFKNLFGLSASAPNTKLDLFNPLSQMLMNPLLFNQYMSLFQNQNLNKQNTTELRSKPIKISPGSMSEPNCATDDESRLKRQNKSSRSLSTSPLDLSRKVNRGCNEIVLGADGNPCPSIDLRKTSFTLKENANGNNNITSHNHQSRPKSAEDRRFPLSKDGSPPKSETRPIFPPASRLQHCKNCDAQFSNLSTFVAHKKFYCPGNISEVASKNVLPKATLAH